MAGREKPTQSAAAAAAAIFASASFESNRTTSYPQGQDGAAARPNVARTTSYRSSIQRRTHDLDSIN